MQCHLRDEEQRLAALYSCGLLDTAPEHAFDRLTRLARMALRVPIVLVSLVDRDRQWFKSSQGLTASETPRSISFCAHAIAQDKPFIVTDAALHPEFCDNPLVVGEPFIRFYIGIPLKMRDGYIIGTLCAIDRQPRALSTEEIDVLQDLAGMVVDAIELRQMATADSLTGALTRRGFDLAIDREFNRARRSRHDLSLVALDVDHFKSINDRYGHAAGDLVLQSLVAMVKQEMRGADFVVRMGGEEFVLALPETDGQGAHRLAERVRERIAGMSINILGHTIRVTASFGVASCGAADTSWTTALEKADAALYRAKRSGRNMSLCYEHLPDSAAA
jgi:diguanylate cyclase (GGDEF)-like protein